jgi:hypothetical protein
MHHTACLAQKLMVYICHCNLKNQEYNTACNIKIEVPLFNSPKLVVLRFNNRGLHIIALWSSAMYSQALHSLIHCSSYIPSLSITPPPSNCSHVEILILDQGGVTCCSMNGLPCTWITYSQSLFCNIYITDILYLNMGTFIFLFCISVQHLPQVWTFHNLYARTDKIIIFFCALFNSLAQNKMVYKWHWLQSVNELALYSN